VQLTVPSVTSRLGLSSVYVALAIRMHPLGCAPASAPSGGGSARTTLNGTLLAAGAFAPFHSIVRWPCPSRSTLLQGASNATCLSSSLWSSVPRRYAQKPVARRLHPSCTATGRPCARARSSSARALHATAISPFDRRHRPRAGWSGCAAWTASGDSNSLVLAFNEFPAPGLQ
jgi:hypothetical protein